MCRDCLADVERFPEDGVCSVCGAPVPVGIDLCRECAVEPRPFVRARAIGPYRGALRTLVLGLKYGGERLIARLLGELARGLLPGDAEAVTFVPQDPGRRRPWNAAELLAREVAARAGLPVIPLLRKVRSTPPQVALGREERRENLLGAFAARRRGAGESVLLVDDIYTTGSTVGECSRAILEAGFGGVFVLTAARTVPDDDDED